MLIQGNEACTQGAIAAGCRFYAGYPITPSSEIMEKMAVELPKIGGKFIQMEDEIASIAAVIGATWAGAKAMTATSGPGLTLMLENIGYAIMTETPCVIVDIQRAGPSTGQATKPAAGDMQQVRWGASGDYEIIALAPWSVKEMYELTIHAFNLAETYRVPVFLMADEAVGHLKEEVELNSDIQIVPRAKKSNQPPFGSSSDEVTPMPGFGQGRKLLVTGSTHDVHGYRKTQAPEVQARLIKRLNNKVRAHLNQIQEIEKYFMDDAQIVIVAYGFTARSALRAVKLARKQDKKIGLLRLKTIWPFPDRLFENLDAQITKVIVPEMNQGQIYREVVRSMAVGAKRLTANYSRQYPGKPGLPDYCVPDRVNVLRFNKTNGQVIEPREISELI